jgi:hypothetical protein
MKRLLGGGGEPANEFHSPTTVVVLNGPLRLRRDLAQPLTLQADWISLCFHFTYCPRTTGCTARP